MNEIVAGNGKVIRRSKNSRGVRRYLKDHTPDGVRVICRSDGGAELRIFFQNGACYKEQWASLTLLLTAIKNWKNLYGTALEVYYRDVGLITKKLDVAGILTML